MRLSSSYTTPAMPMSRAGQGSISDSSSPSFGILFAGGAQDRFKASEKANVLSEQSAQTLAAQTFHSELIDYYRHQMESVHRQLKMQAQSLKAELLHTKHNPTRLNYFTLLELIQELSDERPDRFLEEITSSQSDLHRMAAKRLLPFSRHVDANVFQNISTGWNDQKDLKGCFPDELEDVMGETEKAYLQTNLKRLEENKLITSSLPIRTGHIQESENGKYQTVSKPGLTITEKGQAVLSAGRQESIRKTLVEMIAPDPSFASNDDYNHFQSIRKTLENQPLSTEKTGRRKTREK
jgi:hypothetical protein